MFLKESSLIGAEARRFVERDYASIAPEELPIWERPGALKILTREGDSLVRISTGFIAWLAGVAGAACLGAVFWNGTPIWFRIVSLLLAIALLFAALSIGRPTWRAGRMVTDAFCWWTLMPEWLPEGGGGVEDWRAARVRDAIDTRLFLFGGWRIPRIVLAVLSIMSPLVFLVSLQDSPRFHPTWQDGQAASVTVFSIMFAVVAVSAAIFSFGGVFRANRAHSERDPIQRFLLRRDK